MLKLVIEEAVIFGNGVKINEIHDVKLSSSYETQVFGVGVHAHIWRGAGSRSLDHLYP